MVATIYSANIFQIFSGPIFAILFFFLFAISGWLFLRSEKKPHLDLPLTAAVVLLLAAGIIVLAATVYSFTLGAETTRARLTQKDAITRNTARGSGGTYRLYFGPLVAFEEPDKGTFDRMTEGECYEITSYQNLLPSAFLDQNETGTRVTSLVAEIKSVATNNCP